MKARLNSFFERIFYTPKPLPAGTYQTSLEFDGKPFRLHLRIEDDRSGILVINAATILHLNSTASEIAYYLVQKMPVERITAQLVKRFQVSPEVAGQDIQDFKIRVETLMQTPDLDPETFLDMERIDAYPDQLSSPIRLDCAVTYDTSDGHAERYAPVDRVKRQLDTEEWKVILNIAWTAGIPHIVFTGGEPTLRPDLVELISYAESLGQVTGVITDGIRLTGKDYLHALLSAGLDHLMIILDPAEEECWESIRDASSEDIYLNVHLTITQKLMDTLPAVFERLYRLGVRSLSLSAEHRSNKEQLQQAHQKATEIGFKLTYDLPVPYSAINPISLELEESQERTTGSGRTWLYVEPDGDVLPGQGINHTIGNMLTDDWITISANRKLKDQA